MPVEFNLRVLNPRDGFHRILGLWVDSPPPEGWTIDLARQNTAAFKTFVEDGDTVRGSLDLSDGKHDIYVAISQTSSERLGKWTIEGSFDGVKAPTLSAVDHDTVGRYQLVVRDGKVVSSSEDDATRELEDLTGVGALESSKEALIKAKDALIERADMLKNTISSNKKESAIIGGASVALSAIAAVFTMRRGRRF